MTAHQATEEAQWTEQDLVHVALRLGAADIAGWSPGEDQLAQRSELTRGSGPSSSVLKLLREQIIAGDDPLGRAFVNARSPDTRRKTGATFTPPRIVRAMVAWAQSQERPTRVIDPGCGSGRFVLQAGQAFPGAQLVGVELDPLAAIIARANLAVSGFTRRSRIVVQDYRATDLRSASHRTLFIGNPPYVRHHLVAPRWKQWLARSWSRFGRAPSRLAGLHVYFFLATLLNASEGDLGAYLTAAEWLDVNYGMALRESFLHELGGEALITFAPTVEVFPDAASTALISLFKVGNRRSHVRIKRAKSTSQLEDLGGGRLISRQRMTVQSRWSQLTAKSSRRVDGTVELGELCRVHRGQATGSNDVWIAGEDATLLPAEVLFPAITRAREIIHAGRELDDLASLRRVVDIPADLDAFEGEPRRAIAHFLRSARRRGAHTSYIAQHRRAWWCVALRAPAPILATYMARRPPVFTYNSAGARHLNIAHGLYPREAMTKAQLLALVDHLSTHVSVADGRTYAGGLTKFEPKEMERLRVPRV